MYYHCGGERPSLSGKAYAVHAETIRFNVWHLQLKDQILSDERNFSQRPWRFVGQAV